MVPNEARPHPRQMSVSLTSVITWIVCKNGQFSKTCQAKNATFIPLNFIYFYLLTNFWMALKALCPRGLVTFGNPCQGVRYPLHDNILLAFDRNLWDNDNVDPEVISPLVICNRTQLEVQFEIASLVRSY